MNKQNSFSNKTIEALKMAIEALEVDEFGFVCKRTHDKRLSALMKCCSALEEEDKIETHILLDQVQFGNSVVRVENIEKQEWKSLSNDEIEYLECLKAPPVHPDFINDDSWYDFARAIEAKLKEKNHE